LAAALNHVLDVGGPEQLPVRPRLGDGVERGLPGRAARRDPLGEAGSFCIKSTGLLAGASGSVAYRLEGHGGCCEFDYAVPQVGPNRYVVLCPDDFRVEQSGGGGDAAQVQFLARRAE
jgi:hypothetical protein